ncbi:o-succinylbenzoate synthase [Mangrovibacillus cuniculi]|uniref:o-succinylbenzoate synthase n=1 Tax=Mangrovibacillus cuniculi TaxID=2593652 RepID=A0A7S8HGD3_9BACI|nr:o-succinylbenzoate synthase [Mangrovibacillus cuniculi]QPC47315.1 o-succinylbenzoate synthase [Mangrovibacillus cuniculi]
MIGKIIKATLNVIEMPLKRPFSTHLQSLHSRKGILLELQTEDGVIGLGEAVAFESPWYTEETVETEIHALQQWLLPIIIDQTFDQPIDAYIKMSNVRRNYMSKAAIDMALWDIYAKVKQMNLADLIGSKKKEMYVGAVLATSSFAMMKNRAEELYRDGYTRFKVKIDGKETFEQIKELKRNYPNIAFMVDANGAFTLDDMDLLKEIDKEGFLLIEQPFAVDDLVEHSLLQRTISTPVCLDESITSIQELKTAHALGAIKALNVKVGRVGGLTPALEMIEYCREHGIEVWCGGMIEFGVSRAVNVALASREEFDIPGDIVASDVYWEHDVVTDPVKVKDGKVHRYTKAGIGVELDYDFVKTVTIKTITM